MLIMGSGWGGNKLARRLDKSAFDVRLISPSNHFLFTPLLPSSAVGTLEFRAIQEPVRTIAGLAEYYQAKGRTLDTDARTVVCEDIFRGTTFSLPYDYLCIATGGKTATFGTPGVAEREVSASFPIISCKICPLRGRPPGRRAGDMHRPLDDLQGREVFFLKHLHHARQIRNRVLECFERCVSSAKVAAGMLNTPCQLARSVSPLS
eukprot:SAG11_NODE_791_length_7146_cov_49.170427_9_plen_206_part_00